MIAKIDKIVEMIEVQKWFTTNISDDQQGKQQITSEWGKQA